MVFFRRLTIARVAFIIVFTINATLAIISHLKGTIKSEIEKYSQKPLEFWRNLYLWLLVYVCVCVCVCECVGRG